MTRDDFSSTTLIAIQFPYMITIMKIRIVMPNASMSWPTVAAVSRVGSVFAGSGQVTAKSAGANSAAWSAGLTPSRVEAVGDRDGGRRLADEAGGAAGGRLVGVEGERELARMPPRSRPRSAP